MGERYEFDEAYYERFYNYPRIRASDVKEFAVLGDFVCAYLRYLSQPVRRVLDIGCGLGFWQDSVARHYPKASYTGVEISEYLCERYGRTRGSVVDFEARAAFDLVICTDVLQYLSHAQASAAIENLATLCRGALYFNLLTREDWERLRWSRPSQTATRRTGLGSMTFLPTPDHTTSTGSGLPARGRSGRSIFGASSGGAASGTTVPDWPETC